MTAWLVAVMVLSVLEVADPTPASAVALFADDGATSMTRAGNSVVWSNIAGCPGFELAQATCNIRTRPSPDARYHSTFGNAAGSREDDVASNVAADDTYAYWISAGGRILRVPLMTMAPVAPTHITSKVDPTTIGDIAVDDTWIYWTENDVGRGTGMLYRRLKAPGSGPFASTAPLFTHSRPLRKLASDGQGGALVIADFIAGIVPLLDHLVRIAPDGRYESSGSVLVDSFTVDDSRVYWVTHGPGVRRGDRDPEIRSARPVRFADGRVLQTLSRTGSPTVPSMSVSSDGRLYWQEARAGVGSILRMSVDGGSAASVTGPVQRALDIVATDLYVAWRVAAGQIYSEAVGVAAEVVDLVGDEVPLEVVQVIQRAPEHDVPLIAGKRTFVRMYGRIDSTTGRTEVMPWPGAELHGARDGARLPGSPLMPLNPSLRLRTDPIDRSRLRATYLFELPESWTHGDVTLSGILNPRMAVRESDESNNTTHREVTFGRTKGICLEMIPVDTHAGPSLWTTRPRFDAPHRSHFERAKSLLPTARVEGIFRGGPAVGSYDLTSDLHQAALVLRLMVGSWLSSPACRTASWRSVMTVAAPDASRFGMHLPGGMFFLVRFGGRAENEPLGGVKGLAHELGHELGRSHVNCGGPSMPFESYPLPRCRIDLMPNQLFGLDGMAPATEPRLIVPSDGWTDLMSYGDPNWVSRQVYSRMRSSLGSAGAAATLAGATTSIKEPPSERLLLAGVIPAEGASLIGHGVPVSGDALARVSETLLTESEQSGVYELRIYDAHGMLMGTQPLNTLPVRDDVETHAFAQLVDPIAGAVRADVAPVGGVPVATLTAGASVPEVQILPPLPSVISDTMKLRWVASDADGDTLESLVRYSPDGGHTWITLGSGVRDRSLDVDMSAMPGGANALVEVIASDGLHHATATAGPFLVPTKAPMVQILNREFDVLGATPPAAAGTLPAPTPPASANASASMRFGDTVRWRAETFDPERGPLEPEAIRWSVRGPVSFDAVGENLHLRDPERGDLPPGTYDVELAVTDEEQKTAIAKATLVVGAKPVRAIDHAPSVNGSCDEDSYADDVAPSRIRYADRTTAEARMLHRDGTLHVCVNGLPSDTGAGDEVVVRVAAADQGAPNANAPRDHLFIVDRDGAVRSARTGPGGSVEPDPFPIGFAAVAGSAGRSWSAEMAIDKARLGDLRGKVVGVRVEHGWTDDDGARVEAAWPASSEAKDPASWGDVVLYPGDNDLPPPTGIQYAATALTLKGPNAVGADSQATYRGYFDVHGGANAPQPMAFQEIEILVNGKPVASARTGVGGEYEVAIPFGAPGSLQLVAVAYRGTPAERRSDPITVRIKD